MQGHSKAFPQGILSYGVTLRTEVVENLFAIEVKPQNEVLRMTSDLGLALNLFGLGLAA